ncbi:MAG: hypothetical protein NUV82_04520 [Candidatus Komeilibacteria bacterium]|nr:hypothetical protein [Candidatus Komeilibacteria bacterium]
MQIVKDVGVDIDKYLRKQTGRPFKEDEDVRKQLISDLQGVLFVDRDSLYKYQEIFDYVLKIYALSLQKAYTISDSAKADLFNHIKNGQNNSLPRYVLAKLVEYKEKAIKQKEEAERNFRNLIDALRQIGFEVWDEESYSLYTLLETPDGWLKE